MIDATENTARRCRGRVKDHHDFIEKMLGECMAKGLIKKEACGLIGEKLHFSPDAIRKHMENAGLRYVRAGKSEPKKKSHKKYESRKIVAAPSPYAGMVECLGYCGRTFFSEDRRYNRICPNCTVSKAGDLEHASSWVALRGGMTRRAQE